MLSRQMTIARCGFRLQKRCHTLRPLSTRADGIFRSPFKDVVIPDATVAEHVWQNLDRWSDKTAVVCGETGRSYTYERLHRSSATLAASLRRKLRLADGHCVAIMLTNCPDFPAAQLGVLMAGGVVSGINPIHTPYEIQRQLKLSDSKYIITSAEATPTVKEALKTGNINIPIIVIKNKDEPTPEDTILFNELTEDPHADLSCLKEVRRKPEDVALLPYSSGTTGMPKGVETTHRNLVANIEQINEERLCHMKETTASHQDVVMAILPFFHCYGSTMVLLNKLAGGAKIVTMPKFKPELFLKTIKKYRTNRIYAAPPIVLAMTSHPLSSAEYLEPIELVMCGAAPLPIVDVNRLFEKANRKFCFVQGYGLTETSPMATLTPADLENYTSVGFPMPNTEIKIVDSNGRPAGDGEQGELLIRGPQVMRGYHNNPEATADAIRDGWFLTGDLGRRDEDGLFYISERLKELIKVKGFQVAPAELEALLREHPGVSDAVVIGVTDSRSGEVPKAFIVKKEGVRSDAEDIKAFVNNKVAPYKKLGDLVFIDSIPKNPSGKILRREIRAMYADH